MSNSFIFDTDGNLTNKKKKLDLGMDLKLIGVSKESGGEGPRSKPRNNKGFGKSVVSPDITDGIKGSIKTHTDSTKPILQPLEPEPIYLSPIQHSIIKTLENKGPLTRRDLVKQLNFPRTTTYDNLLKLQKAKIVEKYSRNDGTQGRPLVIWKIREQEITGPLFAK